MLIDINAHLGHYPFRQLRYNDTPGLLSLMDRNNIHKAVVSSLHAVFYRDAHRGNEELTDWVSEAPERLIPLATVNPTYAGWERDMDQALTEWNMKGIRLVPQYHGYSLTDASGQKALAVAAEHGVPVVLPQRLEDRRQKHHFDEARDLSFDEVLAAARLHPDLRVVFLNWLGINGGALVEAGMKERVLIDLTRMPVVLQKDLPSLIEILGIGSVAFGTHIPFNYPGPSLIKLELLNVSSRDRKRIAWKNAAEILGIEDMQ